MNDVKGSPILAAACFRLGMYGAKVTHTFAERVAPTGLSHKQVGLLAIVDAGVATSQREISQRLQVAPSLVVSLVDQLVELRAVRRERNSTDRRIQVIELTDRGRELLTGAEQIARVVDEEMRAGLTAKAKAALDALIAELDPLDPGPNTAG